MKVIGGVTIGVVLLIFRAWTLTWLWLWFVVPFGAPAINMPWAYGLVMLIGALQGVTTTAENKEPDWTTTFITSAVVSGYTLALGWLAHLLMA